MTEALCEPFASCEGLDGRLLISAAIQGPPLAWDLGEVSFGAFTSNGVAARPFVDIHLEQTWTPKESLLRADPLDLQPRPRRDGRDLLVRAASGRLHRLVSSASYDSRSTRGAGARVGGPQGEHHRSDPGADEGQGDRGAEDAVRRRLRVVLGDGRQHHRPRRRRSDRQRGRGRRQPCRAHVDRSRGSVKDAMVLGAARGRDDQPLRGRSTAGASRRRRRDAEPSSRSSAGSRTRTATGRCSSVSSQCSGTSRCGPGRRTSSRASPSTSARVRAGCPRFRVGRRDARARRARGRADARRPARATAAARAPALGNPGRAHGCERRRCT